MQNILLKQECETNPKYGKQPEQRTVEELLDCGLINLNKPAGPSSHQTADYVKKVLHVKKAGHSGTLDPKVTGVLPIALGKATRLMQFFLLSAKEYVGLAYFHKDIEREAVERGVRDFLGIIEQLPPVRSAVKRRMRQREIYEFEVLEFSGRLMLFRVKCQAGTYIRKLIFDLGKHLKAGAHMLELIRTKVGIFSDKNWVTLHELSEAYYLWKEKNDCSLIKRHVLPIESAVSDFKKIWITDACVANVCYGANIAVPGICKLSADIQKGEWLAVLSLKNELVCMGKSQTTSDEIMKSKKGIAVSGIKVFMERGVYPK